MVCPWIEFVIILAHIVFTKNDIVYKDYLNIKDFVEKQIKKYKKEKINTIIKYNNYIKFIKNYKKISFIEKFYASDNLKLYNLNQESDVEFLNKMYLLDDGRVLMGAIAKEIHQKLNNEDRVDNLNPDVLIELKKELEEDEKENSECDPTTMGDVTLSKKYFDLDDLLQDNNKNIMYDKKYDTTRYDIADDLNAKETMSYEELVEHLERKMLVLTEVKQL